MIVSILIFIAILGVVVLVHEFGHFLFAKIFGVCVYEFSIGMGPAIISRQSKKSETKYSIRAIPIGGFCSLAGEETDPKALEKTKGRNLQDKSAIQRFLIMFMGVGFNFIFALIVLFFIGILFGSPNVDPIIASVNDNTPAAIAGIEAGDKVLAINDRKVSFRDDVLLYLTVEDIDSGFSIKIEKPNKDIKVYNILPEKQVNDGKTTYLIGIALKDTKDKGFVSALRYAVKQEASLFKQMFIVLKSLFTGKVSVKDLSGPVGVYTIVDKTRGEGAASVIYLIALLCVNVGVVNLIPLPAFDGGRIIFLIIEKIKGSPIKPEIENRIHSIGFILLILLMLYVTFNDILRLF